MELHTFSSLSENFLEQYAGSMNDADVPVVYFNPQTIAHKKLAAISTDQVAKAFENKNLVVFTDQEAMRNHIQNSFTSNSVLLMMSSGTFDGLDLHKIQF